MNLTLLKNLIKSICIHTRADTDKVSFFYTVLTFFHQPQRGILYRCFVWFGGCTPLIALIIKSSINRWIMRASQSSHSTHLLCAHTYCFQCVCICAKGSVSVIWLCACSCCQFVLITESLLELKASGLISIWPLVFVYDPMAFCVLIGSDTAGQQLIGSTQLLTFLPCWRFLLHENTQTQTYAHTNAMVISDLYLILTLSVILQLINCKQFAKDVIAYVEYGEI